MSKAQECCDELNSLFFFVFHKGVQLGSSPSLEIYRITDGFEKILKKYDAKPTMDPLIVSVDGVRIVYKSYAERGENELPHQVLK